MKTLRTEIVIEAAAQTVWSILDDLARYAEWNKVIPKAEGLTTVGSSLHASIAFSGMVANPFNPMLTRIVGARELRWVTELPGEHGYRAEHSFVLTPMAADRTHLEHCEAFEGPMTEMIWPMMDGLGRRDYEAMNVALKARAEAAERTCPSLHPAIDDGLVKDAAAAIRSLRCRCDEAAVEAKVSGPVWHAHLCGCTRCWKPHGAVFALTAVAAAGTVQIVTNADKLQAVDGAQSIVRSACKACGAHIIGRVHDRNHHFYGLEFIHPELAIGDAPAPEFAGFVSSVIEAGASPTRMTAIRKRLTQLAIPAYDSFSPELMDLIAWHRVKIAHSGAA